VEDRDPFHMPMVKLQSTVQGSLQSWLDRLQKPFYPSMELYDRYAGQEYTAIYSQDKDYLFDEDNAKFFSPAARWPRRFMIA